MGTLIALFFEGSVLAPRQMGSAYAEYRLLQPVDSFIAHGGVDATQYVNLYPELHRMLGGIAFVLGVVGFNCPRIHRSINLSYWSWRY